MTEEEIKKEIKELAESDLNREYLEDLDVLDKFCLDYLDKEAQTDIDNGNILGSDDAFEMSKAAMEGDAQRIQRKHGQSISSQIQSFFDGPADASDEKVSQWVKDNYRIVRLLACSHMPEALKEGNASSFLFALCYFAKKMPAAVTMAKNFMLKYHKEAVANNDKYPELNDEDYQSLMQGNLKDLKDQQANLPEKDKKMLDTTKTFLAESGYFYRDNRETFDKFAENLEKAKTFRNSEEYETLIKWVKNINSSKEYISKNDTYKGRRTDLQNYSMKLFAVKSVINNYLNHKAKDGVKKNTYEKLAAVEELNSFVSQELEKYKPDYNERENAHRTGKEIVNCTYTAWRETFNKVPEAAVMPDKQRAALNCMGRIIARAEKQQLSKDKIHELNNMCTAFGGDGIQNAPDEAKPITL